MEKFETGKVYACRSVCDYECIFSYLVTGRSEKTVTLAIAGGGGVTRKIRVDGEGGEYCFPKGIFSMAPVLRAGPSSCTLSMYLEGKGNKSIEMIGGFFQWTGPDGKTGTASISEVTEEWRAGR